MYYYQTRKQIFTAYLGDSKFFNELVTHSLVDSFTLYSHKLDTSNVT